MIVMVRGKNGLQIFFDQIDKILELKKKKTSCNLSTFPFGKGLNSFKIIPLTLRFQIIGKIIKTNIF